MNYFDKYEDYDENDITFHKLIKIEDSYYINDIEVENNRGISEDLVVIKDNKVINIKERNNEKIVGYINLNSPYKMKINNKIYHLFNPLDKKYEQFYVSLNTDKYKGKIYTIINFKCWDENSKYPHGNLIDIIGKVGDIDNDILALMYHYQVYQKKMTIDKNKINNDIEYVTNLKKSDCEYNIFTIDPKGSKDLDDGFHFEKKENNIFEIGIHIACPILFLKEYLHEILNRCCTVYTTKNINLIPDIYSENICSLLEKKNRKTMSIILQFNERCECIGQEIKESSVYIMKNYDYDTFDEKHYNSDRFQEWIQLSERYFNSKLDSHTIVEKWMISTNKIIAKHLINNNFENVILRVFEEKNDESQIVKNDEILNKIIHQYKQDAAVYKLYNEEKKLSFIHSSFDGSYYTHFTSPIRRSIDFYNQSLLLDKISTSGSTSGSINKKELEVILDKYTQYEKKLKKFYRSQTLLKFINENDTNMLEEEAYIIRIKKNKLRLYLSNYKIEVEAFLFKYKFMELFDASYLFDNNSITYIHYNNDGKEYEYNLYDKLKIQVYFYPKEVSILDKIKIKIC